jgi:hypothetical protein
MKMVVTRSGVSSVTKTFICPYCNGVVAVKEVPIGVVIRMFHWQCFKWWKNEKN